MHRHLLTFALALATLSAWAEAPFTVVEVFTSKYCPSCPAAESYLRKEALENPNLLVVLENVDYWNGPGRIDPDSNPDFTQRQYDYSNLLADRPGKVFTPQPVLNGRVVADPPLWLSWSGALKKAPAIPTTLQASATAKGGLIVSLASKPKDAELTVIGLTPIEGTKLWRAKGVKQFPVTGTTVSLDSARLPAGTDALILLQEAGPAGILAATRLSRTP
ncbi:MAG: DUF1223 domain-containing protein [Pseudomonadaceae bacterium]|nr:DUF1223 domain-containing protein [Pseudomonadaceae bacterium]